MLRRMVVWIIVVLLLAFAAWMVVRSRSARRR